MHDILFNYCLRKGGRVDFCKPLDLEGWEHYHLKSLYIDNDELYLVSNVDPLFPYQSEPHIQDIIWIDVCDEFFNAVYDAVVATMNIDKNLF